MRPQDDVASVVGRFLSENAAKHFCDTSIGRHAESEEMAIHDSSSTMKRPGRAALKATQLKSLNSNEAPKQPLVFSRGSGFLRDSRRRTAQKLSTKREIVHNTSIDEDLESRRTVQFSQPRTVCSTTIGPKILPDYRSLLYRKSMRVTRSVTTETKKIDHRDCKMVVEKRVQGNTIRLETTTLTNSASSSLPPPPSYVNKMYDVSLPSPPQLNDSEFLWRGEEKDLPKSDAIPLYQCVVLYIGCQKVGSQRMHTIVLDKTIKHLRDSSATVSTVLLQVYRNYTVVRNSLNKISLAFPNHCISLCLTSPSMPMYMGVILSLNNGGRECVVFGTDRTLLSHRSLEHQKYVNCFGLTCLTNPLGDVPSCPAFPSSPLRIMHHLNFAKSLLLAKCKSPNAKNAPSSNGCKTSKNRVLSGKLVQDLSVSDSRSACLKDSTLSSSAAATSQAECLAAAKAENKSSGVTKMATNGSTDSKSNDIEKLLKNETYRRPFQSFLEQQFCAENLNFYMAVEDYRQIPDSELDRRITVARQIYERHFTANSVEPVNIDNSTNKAIREAVHKEKFTSDLYDVAQYQIFHLLKYDCWPRYIRAGGVAPPSNDDPEMVGSVNRTSSVRQQQPEAAKKKKFCTLMCNETFNSEQIPLTDPRESVGKWTASMAEQRGMDRHSTEVVDAQTGSTIDPARQAVDALNNRSVRLVPVVFFPVEIIAPSASPKSSLSQATMRIVMLRVRQILSAGSVLRPLMVKYSIDSEQSVVCFTGTCDTVPMSLSVGKIPPRSLTIMTSQQYQDRLSSNKREPQRELVNPSLLTNDSNLPFHQHGDIAFCEVPLDYDARLTKMSATRSYSNNPKTDHTSGLMKFMRKASHAVTSKDNDSSTGTSLSHQSSIVVDRQKNDNFRRKSFGSTCPASPAVADIPYCGDSSSLDPKPAKVAAPVPQLSCDSTTNPLSENIPTAAVAKSQQISTTPPSSANGSAPKVPMLYTSAIRSDKDTLTPTDTNSERSIGWQTADYV
ncbi:hypothetical protein QR680_002190 [Steinernema hermaphroditum]|uniref:RGS domain-containing protein n=1 Tax=Steinernema hermaphroditum TaxID=289476 RepID=A0AA39LHR3_9BILA|nr:hypothetical protein QR680_002190 [Steinernema hermaphroditum]